MKLWGHDITFQVLRHKIKHISIRKVADFIRSIFAYYNKQQLAREFTFIDNADITEAMKKFEGSKPKDMINDLIFHDESEPAIRDLENNFLAYFFLGKVFTMPYSKRQKENANVVNDKNKNLQETSYASKKYSIDDGVLFVKSSGFYNWLFFIYKTNSPIYKIEMDIVFFSDFYEFQWALQIKSIYERLRFRLTNGGKLAFEVITHGCFQDDLFVREFTFIKGKTYHINVVIDHNEYYLIIDNICMMKVIDRSKKFLNGDFGLLFYDNEDHLINVEISNITYEEPK